jgi:predicted  nucleic acid-binding Zn-ribbon protein
VVKIPHQCVHCSKIYPDAAQELLAGCSCGSKFFFYIRKEKYEALLNQGNIPVELKIVDKERVEQDVREMIGIEEEQPVILDLESVRVIGPGKFELDIVSLFQKGRPVVYKLEEGKYIIDIGSMINKDSEKTDNKKEA